MAPVRVARRNCSVDTTGCAPSVDVDAPGAEAGVGFKGVSLLFWFRRLPIVTTRCSDFPAPVTPNVQAQAIFHRRQPTRQNPSVEISCSAGAAFELAHQATVINIAIVADQFVEQPCRE